MKDWWRKWSYEIPLAFGDMLWEILVVQFAAFLDRLTLRKVLEFVAIAVLVMAFAQTFPIDLAVLFAGDTLMYLEFAIAVRLAAGKMHLREMLRFVIRLAHSAMRVSQAAISQSMLRINRLSQRQKTPRVAKPRRISDNSDDDRGAAIPWGVFAPA